MSETAPAGTGKLRRNVVSNILGRAGSGLLWVFVTPFVLERLGPERFGVWSLFFALSGYVAILDFGMSSSTARFCALGAARGDRGAVRHALGTSLLLAMALGAVMCGIALLLRGGFVRWFHVPEAAHAEVDRSLVLFGSSLFVYSITQVLQGGLMGLQRLHLSNLWFLAGLLVHAAILLFGLGRGGGLTAAVIGMAAGNAMCGALSGWSLARAIRTIPDGRGPRASWRDLVGFGGLVQVTNAFAVAQVQAGKFLLGLLGQLVWVAQFELGFRVANSLWALPQLMQGAVLPAAAHASADDSGEELRRLYRWACRWQFAFAAWVLGGLWVAAPALFAAWIGPGHPDAVAVAEILSVAFVMACLAGPASIVARGAGWPGYETAWIGGALALNFALCALLIGRMGVVGAAWAAAISYAIAGAWLIPALHRKLALPVREWLLTLAMPRFLPAVLAAAAVRLLTRTLDFGGRGHALLVALLQGALFTALLIVLMWPSGDPAAIGRRVRSWRAGTPAKAGDGGNR